jgi:hypothetical protein
MRAETADDDRPTAFASREGTGNTVSLLERVQQEKKNGSRARRTDS